MRKTSLGRKGMRNYFLILIFLIYYAFVYENVTVSEGLRLDFMSLYAVDI